MEELSSARCLSDLGADDDSGFIIGSGDVSCLQRLTSPHMAAPPSFRDEFRSSFSAESHTSYPAFAPHRTSTAGGNGAFGCSPAPTDGVDRPAGLLKTAGTCGSRAADQMVACSTAVAPDASSSPSILSFGPQHSLRGFVEASVTPKEERGFSITRAAGGAYEYSSMAEQGIMKRAGVGSRPPSQAQDHIIAERKRREKLSQRFIELSAIVPGLKKIEQTDKASVLGDAIKYVKQLQERVKTLEEETAKRTTVDSAVLARRSQLPADDDTSSSVDENFGGGLPDGQPMPEIEAKLSGTSVLVRVHCDKRQGVLAKVLSEIEKLHLTVVSSSSMPFTGSSLDITVTAQMDGEFSMTAKDLVDHLNAACWQFA